MFFSRTKLGSYFIKAFGARTLGVLNQQISNFTWGRNRMVCASGLCGEIVFLYYDWFCFSRMPLNSILSLLGDKLDCSQYCLCAQIWHLLSETEMKGLCNPKTTIPLTLWKLIPYSEPSSIPLFDIKYIKIIFSILRLQNSKTLYAVFIL